MKIEELGTAFEGEEQSALVEDFLRVFRPVLPASKPSNIPTACILNGESIDGGIKAVGVVRNQDVILLFEYPICARKADASRALEFMKLKEPWEDYDCCIFDESLSWCLGVNHNDGVTFVGRLMDSPWVLT